MLIFIPIQDIHPNDTIAEKIEIWWKEFKLSSGHQALMTEHPGSLRKVQKIWKKYKYWKSAKPGTYIMCPHKVSWNIKFEGSRWKIDFRNAKNA